MKIYITITHNEQLLCNTCSVIYFAQIDTLHMTQMTHILRGKITYSNCIIVLSCIICTHVPHVHYEIVRVYKVVLSSLCQGPFLKKNHFVLMLIYDYPFYNEIYNKYNGMNGIMFILILICNIK